MKKSYVGISDWLPKHSSGLEAPRSATSSSDSEERCPTLKKDHGLLLDPRFRFFRYFFFVALVVGVFTLYAVPLSDEWLASSFRCSFQGDSTSSTLPSESVKTLFTADVSTTKAETRLRNEKTAKGSGVKEDEKCFSRTRHFLYRPAERQKRPPPALTKALKAYEALHARCTAGKTWESFSDVPQSEGNDPCQYLLYLDGSEGLGNRFLSLSSAFLWALATDRVLLIDTRRNLSRLLCEPFTGSSWRLPQSFPFEKFDSLPSLNKVENIENVTAMRISLYHIQPHKDQQFFCSDIQKQISHVQWLSWTSNQYYVTRLFMIPAIWKKLVPFFDDPAWIFTHLSRYLFLPRNEIWARIERYYEAYLASSTNLVGFQVRGQRGFSQEVHERLMKCSSLKPRLVPAIIEQPQNTTISTVYSTKNTTAIFVASLERVYHETIKEMYISGETDDGSLVSVHTASSEGWESKAFEQSVKALSEIWLLGFSDSLMTSGYSTFGYVSYGIGAIYPRLLNTNLQTDYFCNTAESFEPCTHHPQLPSGCESSEDVDLTAEHKSWIEAHLKPCADRDIGLHIV